MPKPVVGVVTSAEMHRGQIVVPSTPHERYASGLVASRDQFHSHDVFCMRNLFVAIRCHADLCLGMRSMSSPMRAGVVNCSYLIRILVVTFVAIRVTNWLIFLQTSWPIREPFVAPSYTMRILATTFFLFFLLSFPHGHDRVVASRVTNAY